MLRPLVTRATKMRITIVPASNKTSIAAIRWLLPQNPLFEVHGVYRDLEKVPDEFSSVQDFTAVQGDVADASTLNFNESDAVVMVLPPAYDGRDIAAHSTLISNNVKNAIEKSNTVKRLVLLSSLGVEFAEGVVSMPMTARLFLTWPGWAQNKSHFWRDSQDDEHPRDHLYTSCLLHGELEHVPRDTESTRTILLLNHHTLRLQSRHGSRPRHW